MNLNHELERIMNRFQINIFDKKEENRKIELAEKYLNVVHLTREMVDTLIDYITVGKRIPKTRNVPIEIHWNF